jgi:hypothetical protein
MSVKNLELLFLKEAPIVMINGVVSFLCWRKSLKENSSNGLKANNRPLLCV